MYLFTTVPHPHGHRQLQELIGNQLYCLILLYTVHSVLLYIQPALRWIFFRARRRKKAKLAKEAKARDREARKKERHERLRAKLVEVDTGPVGMELQRAMRLLAREGVSAEDVMKGCLPKASSAALLWHPSLRRDAVFLFSKLNIMCSGYFDPENVFVIVKINNFRGDLTDVLAKREALARCFLIFGQDAVMHRKVFYTQPSPDSFHHFGASWCNGNTVIPFLARQLNKRNTIQVSGCDYHDRAVIVSTAQAEFLDCPCPLCIPIFPFASLSPPSFGVFICQGSVLL